jgi:sec-independent protein translocase protein TatB
MPSFGDGAFIFVLALLLFGPKKLPELARQLGKLMAEFRRASNEFRMQMEEELRVSEQADRQKQIAALDIPEPEHPHLDAPMVEAEAETGGEHHMYEAEPPEFIEEVSDAAPTLEPLPIATSGDLHLMPPATGLPVARSNASESLAPVFDSIPQETEASLRG